MKLSQRRVKLDNDRYCFSAGDLRCNEQLELTVLHTVEWMCNCILIYTIIKDPSCITKISRCGWGSTIELQENSLKSSLTGTMKHCIRKQGESPTSGECSSRKVQYQEDCGGWVTAHNLQRVAANCSWDEVHAGKEIEVLQVARWERSTFELPLSSSEVQHGANRARFYWQL